MMLIRDGQHIVPWQCALVNSMPPPANLSIFGVFVSGCPPMQPIQSFKSSTAINRTFGFLRSGAAAADPRAARASKPAPAAFKNALRFMKYYLLDIGNYRGVFCQEGADVFQRDFQRCGLALRRQCCRRSGGLAHRHA